MKSLLAVLLLCMLVALPATSAPLIVDTFETPQSVFNFGIGLVESQIIGPGILGNQRDIPLLNYNNGFSFASVGGGEVDWSTSPPRS